MKSKHKNLGKITIHHLVPRVQLKDYYGVSFHLPKNKIKLWELKHAAWHVLFGIKTLNQIIRYLNCRNAPYGYGGAAWQIVFKNKTKKQAMNLLLRVRQMIRKQYAHLEFDPYLRGKVNFYYKRDGRTKGVLYLEKRFRPAS